MPDYLSFVQKEEDPRLISTLWRDYSILAAEYMLEPCHLSYLETKNYGLGSSFIPENIAKPMVCLAEKMKYKNYLLDYA